MIPLQIVISIWTGFFTFFFGFLLSFIYLTYTYLKIPADKIGYKDFILIDHRIKSSIWTIVNNN